MATTLSSFGFSPHQVLRKPSSSRSSICFFLPRFAGRRNTRILTIVASSSSSSSSNQFSGNRDDGFSLDDAASLGFDSRPANSPKKSILANLIQEIEPLDVSLIQKEVSPTTLDAMKRTISGMLGLLPSDRFQVLIEALWEPLSKLLVSSMMTGYTLRNAEYRLFLERTLGIQDASSEFQTQENTNFNLQEKSLEDKEYSEPLGQNDILSDSEKISETFSNNMKSLGRMSSEVQEYIHRLQWQLSSIKKELREVKRKNAALQMQQFVGEEKNDLLDYLRSLQPEKVAELSEPTSPEIKETIHSVVHGLLATLSPKVHSKATPSENPSSGTVQNENEDCAELVENTSLQFQPLISLTRDYLARLLFWCMLLGHHLRGLEYRVELTDLVSLPSNSEKDADGFEPIS